MPANPIKLEPVHVLPNSNFLDHQRRAFEAADALAKNEGLTAALRNGIITKLEDIRSTAAIHFSLFETEGLTEEMVASWPEVGSIEGHTGNEPYDIFWFKNADGKKEQASFIRMMAMRHPVGADILASKRKLVDKQAGKTDASGRYKVEKKGLDREFTTFFGKFKVAIQLYQKMKKANEELGTVLEVSYETKAKLDDKGQPVVVDGKVDMETDTKATELIVVEDKARKGVAERFTIANFCRLDVAAAKAAGGTYGAFINSNRREEPDDGDVKPTIVVDSNNAFEDVTLKALEFTNSAKTNPAKWREFVSFYNVAGSDDRLLSLEALRDNLNVLLELPAVKQRLDALNTGTETGKRAALVEAFKDKAAAA